LGAPRQVGPKPLPAASAIRRKRQTSGLPLIYQGGMFTLMAASSSAKNAYMLDLPYRGTSSDAPVS